MAKFSLRGTVRSLGTGFGFLMSLIQVFDADIHNHPPGKRYQYLILRELLARLENELRSSNLNSDKEIDDRILDRYTGFLQDPPDIVPPTEETIITYTAPRIGEIYIAERPSLIVSGGTTGLRTWEASLLLSEWILRQKLSGKKVLELGAGTGLAGIVAAKCGAKVMCTDGSESVVSTVRSNSALNKVQLDADVLWWGEDDFILRQQWDYVVGADITYDEEVCSCLVSSYSLALRTGGVGILAATVRNERTLEIFIKEYGIICFSRADCQGSKGLDVESLDVRDVEQHFFRVHPYPMRLYELRLARTRAEKDNV